MHYCRRSAVSREWWLLQSIRLHLHVLHIRHCLNLAINHLRLLLLHECILARSILHILWVLVLLLWESVREVVAHYASVTLSAHIVPLLAHLAFTGLDGVPQVVCVLESLLYRAPQHCYSPHILYLHCFDHRPISEFYLLDVLALVLVSFTIFFLFLLHCWALGWLLLLQYLDRW